MRVTDPLFICFRKLISLFCSEGETLRKEGSAGSLELCSLTQKQTQDEEQTIVRQYYLNFKNLCSHCRNGMQIFSGCLIMVKIDIAVTALLCNIMQQSRRVVITVISR